MLYPLSYEGKTACSGYRAGGPPPSFPPQVPPFTLCDGGFGACRPALTRDNMPEANVESIGLGNRPPVTI